MVAGLASTIWFAVVGGAPGITVDGVPEMSVGPAPAGAMGRAYLRDKVPCHPMHGPVR